MTNIAQPRTSHGGILTGHSIIEAIGTGDIVVGPYDRENVVHATRRNPASYDLTLGDEVAVYADWVQKPLDDNPHHGVALFAREHGEMDVRKKPKVLKYKMSRERGWLLKPGIGYLMHTHERVCSNVFVPVLDGKSSIGRLFIAVHVTAGYGDVGFDGQYTLEVTALHPVWIYPGMRFCQIRFHTTVGKRLNYQQTGHYKKKLASGPVPSMAWKQFEEDLDVSQVVSGRGRARGR